MCMLPLEPISDCPPPTTTLSASFFAVIRSKKQQQKHTFLGLNDFASLPKAPAGWRGG